MAENARKKGTPAKGKVDAKEKDADKDKAGLHAILRGCQRVVVIGVRGWCPGAIIQTVLGEVSVFFSLHFLILRLIGLCYYSLSFARLA